MHLRIPPPIQGFIAAMLMWGLAHLTAFLTAPLPAGEIVAAIFIALGISVEVIAIAQFIMARTTVNPLKPQNTEKLVIKGLYKYSRNPMYLGLTILLIGWAVWLSNPLATLVLLGFVWTITEWQIKPEEEALKAKFGVDYEDYCAQVGRWF